MRRMITAFFAICGMLILAHQPAVWAGDFSIRPAVMKYEDSSAVAQPALMTDRTFASGQYSITPVHRRGGGGGWRGGGWRGGGWRGGWWGPRYYYGPGWGFYFGLGAVGAYSYYNPYYYPYAYPYPYPYPSAAAPSSSVVVVPQTATTYYVNGSPYSHGQDHCTQILEYAQRGLLPQGWTPEVFNGEVIRCRDHYYPTLQVAPVPQQAPQVAPQSAPQMMPQQSPQVSPLPPASAVPLPVPQAPRTSQAMPQSPADHYECDSQAQYATDFQGVSTGTAGSDTYQASYTNCMQSRGFQSLILSQ